MLTDWIFWLVFFFWNYYFFGILYFFGLISDFTHVLHCNILWHNLSFFHLMMKVFESFYDWVFQIISQRFTLSNYEICLLKPINAQNILQKYFEVVLIYLTFTIWFVSVKKLEEERKRLELLIEEHQSYNGKK